MDSVELIGIRLATIVLEDDHDIIRPGWEYPVEINPPVEASQNGSDNGPIFLVPELVKHCEKTPLI
jgi:hypothetical protein